MKPSVSRRSFLQSAAVAGAGMGLATTAAEAAGATGRSSAPPARKPGQKSVFGLTAPPMSKVRVRMIGMGGRGISLLGNLLDIDGVEIKAVCDIVTDRVRQAQQHVVAEGRPEPAGYSKGETDFENLCRRDDLDAIYIATPWDWHVPMALCAMKNGKHAMPEVPAAITIDECWQLVDTAEQTQRHCMMLENCCYGETELLVLSMVRQGLLGDLTHGEAGYLHDCHPVAARPERQGLAIGVLRPAQRKSVSDPRVGPRCAIHGHQRRRPVRLPGVDELAGTHVQPSPRGAAGRRPARAAVGAW